MIKTIYDIILGDVFKLERKDDAKHLKKWYNPFPIKWWPEERERLTREIFDKINGEDSSDNLRHEKEKEIIRGKNLELKIARAGIAVNMSFLPRSISILNWAKRKYKKHNSKLNKYLEAVKKITGYEIKTAEDVKRLDKEIERRYDKFIETFPEENPNNKTPEPQKKFTFGDKVARVYLQTPQSFNERTKLLHFLALERQLIEMNTKKPKEDARD
jgi:hypothetical protein